MSITYSHGKVVVDFRSDWISGESGLGCFRIKFRFDYITKSWPDEQFEFRNAKAEASICGLGRDELHFLGLAEPEKAVIIRTSPQSHNSYLTFNLTLNSHQISLLEDIRSGNNLRFKLRIFGEVYGKEGYISASDEIPVPVNQTEWLDVLKQMRYGNFLLFEIPIPSNSESKNLKSAVDLMSQANNHFILGNYEETVAVCRKALESLTQGLGETKKQSEAKKKFKDAERAMSKEERFYFLCEKQ